MIKLQMLLQFKLENIKELIPTTSTTTTTSTSTCTTSTCTTSTCSTTTKIDCSCSLIGNGIGCITNHNDKFYGETVKLYSYITCCDVNNRSFHYIVKNDNEDLEMYSSGHNIKIQCPCDCKDKIVVYGQGWIEKQAPNNQRKYPVDFTLTVWNKSHILELKMEIQSRMDPQFNHESGIVQVKFVNSDSRLKICCDDQCNSCQMK